MRISSLKKHFGERPVPDLLVELAKFDDTCDGESFSGYLELDDFEGEPPCQALTGEEPEALGGAGSAADKVLAMFAREGDGSMYALWFHDGVKDGNAPVVFIESEGSDDTAVIANDLQEFVSLLLMDIEEVGANYETFDGGRDEDEDHAEKHAEFVKWAKKRGISPASNAAQVVKAARARHPDFGQWMTGTWEALRGGDGQED
jgi:hypothetical protein